MRRRQSVFGTLILAAIFFAGGFFAWQYLTQPMAEEAAASEEWPSTTGVITHSELTKSRDSDGNDLYSANIHYSYSIDNKEYSDYGVTTMDGSTSMKRSVKKTVKKYKVGTEVTVYYDPEFPNTAVLEPGASFLLGILLKLPLLFCLASVLMVLGVFKRLFFGR